MGPLDQLELEVFLEEDTSRYLQWIELKEICRRSCGTCRQSGRTFERDCCKTERARVQQCSSRSYARKVGQMRHAICESTNEVVSLIQLSVAKVVMEEVEVRTVTRSCIMWSKKGIRRVLTDETLQSLLISC